MTRSHIISIIILKGNLILDYSAVCHVMWYIRVLAKSHATDLKTTEEKTENWQITRLLNVSNDVLWREAVKAVSCTIKTAGLLLLILRVVLLLLTRAPCPNPFLLLRASTYLPIQYVPLDSLDVLGQWFSNGGWRTPRGTLEYCRGYSENVTLSKFQPSQVSFLKARE